MSLGQPSQLHLLGKVLGDVLVQLLLEMRSVAEVVHEDDFVQEAVGGHVEDAPDRAQKSGPVGEKKRGCK